MNDSKISVRYSRALFESAIEKKLLEKVAGDMQFVLDLCSVPEAKELLSNPVIKPSRKREIFTKLMGEKVEKITLSLISLVVTNGREAYLPAIAREFIRQTRVHKGVTELVLTTAVKPDPSVKEKISALVEEAYKTRTELIEVIDPDIIGGFILKIEDNYLDASVRNKLRKIEKQLKGTTLDNN
jgi:F-type H+-transporting ATPase subunit delta